MRLLKSAGAVAAIGLLVAGCSAPTASDHAGSTSSPPPPSSPQRTQMVTFTSTMAALTLPAAVSRPTVFASGGRLLVVGGLTAADDEQPSPRCEHSRARHGCGKRQRCHRGCERHHLCALR